MSSVDGVCAVAFAFATEGAGALVATLGLGTADGVESAIVGTDGDGNDAGDDFAGCDLAPSVTSTLPFLIVTDFVVGLAPDVVADSFLLIDTESGVIETVPAGECISTFS